MTTSYHTERFRRVVRAMISTSDQLTADLRRLKRETDEEAELSRAAARVDAVLRTAINALQAERDQIQEYLPSTSDSEVDTVGDPSEIAVA